MTSGIDRVRAALRRQDVDPSHEELLDILWLARAMARDDGGTVRRWANGADPAADPLVPAEGPAAAEPGSQLQDPAKPAANPRERLHAPARLPGTSSPGRPVRVPGRLPISDPLQLRRALRPLRRYRRPSWTPHLDETATANLIAETSLLQLVHRSEALRSRDLLLVVDDGTSMRLWQDMAAELQRLLRNLGAFRRVIAIGLDSDRAERAVVHTRPFGTRRGALPRRGGPRHSSTVLMFSDGVGAGWRSGVMRAFLEQQCAHSTVAVLQPLPPTLWSGTALQPTRLALTAPLGGAANRLLGSSDPLLPDVVAMLPGLPVPLIELSPGQLRDWAVLAATGGTVTLPVIDARPPVPVPAVEAAHGAAATGGATGPPSAPERLAAFRTAASPQAFRLAAHLSTVRPLTLPVMRVVQEAVLPGSHPGYLAEVFLGGLLRATSPRAAPADAVYALHPGVADLLMSAVDTGDALNTVRVVSAYLERPTARTASLSAILADPHGSGRIPDVGNTLAEVGGPFLRYLGILPPTPASAPTPNPASTRPPAEPAALESARPETDRTRSQLDRLTERLAVERAGSGARHPDVAALELRLAALLVDTGALTETASLVKQVLAGQRLNPGSGARPTSQEQRLLQELVERLTGREPQAAPGRFAEAISLAAELNQIPGLYPLDWLIDALCPPAPRADARYQLTRIREALSRTGDSTAALLTALRDAADAVNAADASAAYGRSLAALREDRDRHRAGTTVEEREAARPYFFLSYAHTPGTGSSGHDPNLWVYRLYDDLCEAITEIAPHTEGVPVGFMDRGMHLGEGWAERVSEALANCRVFVPLYSPRYFRSETCGQEWSCFASRPVVRSGADNDPSGIVPVLWVRVPRENLPEVAARIQFLHPSLGTDYRNEGTLALSKLGYFRESYELVVHRLAQRIVDVAESVEIETGTTENLLSRVSAFAAPPPSRQMRISVLACDTRRLPPGRADLSYGSNALDWQPYWRESDLSLAQHAQSVLRKLNFHTSVHLFEDEAELLLAPSGSGPGGAGPGPSAPGVLLLDRWALLDPERRALVKRFDELNPGWVSVLEPWAEDDPDRRDAEDGLGELAGQILRRKRGENRIQDGLPTLAAFDRELPLAALRALRGFEDRIREQRPEPPGRPRPSLRDALTGGAPRGSGAPGSGTDHGTPETGSAKPGSTMADPAEENR
ncbi:TIR-like protein FxsC [Streptacidiphilus sp. P02-A3a]|uniref:TIR-like protein FxsC n=1 Tax=Streptacidiphilus sp. P02-A3a TaxID=2704468 RepID=UPI0015FA39DF|nr:TIR-like protein FxsC [Streptacidiphilus sp. P02-A3a]QMU68282.1 TIR domain-containing protein [Streptacidiphilus sp. P02-A3a]